LLRLLHRLHRITGVILLLPVFVSALSGALLAALDPLRPPRVEALPRVNPGIELAALEQAFADARARHGDDNRFLIRPPRADDEALVIQVDGAAWHGRHHFHPLTGELLGSVDFSRDPGHWLFELHDSLLLDEIGKSILLASAIGTIILTTTGISVWLRGARRRRRLSLRLLHRRLGAWFAAAIIIAFISGTYMVWRPLSTMINWIAGTPTISAPKPRLGSSPDIARISTFVENANTVLPGGHIGYIAIAPQGKVAVRIRKRLPDDPHPNGLSSVWLEPSTGEPIGQVRWSDLDPGSRLFSWIYPLHSGHLGGDVQRLLWVVTGLCTAFLAYSGARIWLRGKS
jgi:uncharacterized iron-regulated membrane protein